MRVSLPLCAREMKPRPLMASVILLYTCLSVILLNYTAADKRRYHLYFVVSVWQLLSHRTSMRLDIIQKMSKYFTLLLSTLHFFLVFLTFNHVLFVIPLWPTVLQSYHAHVYDFSASLIVS